MIDTRRKLYAVLTVVMSVCAALLLGEVALRFYAPSEHFVWNPNLEKIFRPLPGLMPGIVGESRFVINASGMRGDPFPDDGRYAILAIGGSTTESLYLGPSRSVASVAADQIERTAWGWFLGRKCRRQWPQHETSFTSGRKAARATSWN